MSDMTFENSFQHYSAHLSTSSNSVPHSYSSVPSIPFPSHAPPAPFLPHYNPLPVSSPCFSSNYNCNGPTHVPWVVWGPQSTRWFREQLSTDWQHSVYGLRTVDFVSQVPRRTSLSDPQSSFSRHCSDGSPNTAAKCSIEPPLDSTESYAVQDSAVFVQESPIPSTPIATSQSTPSPSASAPIQSSGHSTNGFGPTARRHLRLRDYNIYTILEQLREEEAERHSHGDPALNNQEKGKGKGSPTWCRRHAVIEPSTTDTQGVFKHDVTSYLPYVEIISEETFQVTDVMMDDCRLLLLKRGDNGKLHHVDVLTM